MKNLCWIPDIPDARDYVFKADRKIKLDAAAVDWSGKIRKVWDQGNLGSCTAHSTAAQCWAMDVTDPLSYEPSRLFIYYQTRLLGNTIGWDSGGSIRNAIKSVVKFGYSKEESWPYKPVNYLTKPANTVYKEARTETVLEYGRVAQKQSELQKFLIAGFFINLGISVYSSFPMNDGIDYVKLPDLKNDKLLGGHAILLVGYNNLRR